MTTDELLAKLPAFIGNHKTSENTYVLIENEDQIGHLQLLNDGKDWQASYGREGEYVCMNPNSPNPPYDNAFAYGETLNEALQGLYDWCVKHGFIKN